MSDSHPAWMAGRVDQVREKVRREAEEKLARTRAQEEAARGEEIRRAETRALAARANDLAAQMTKDVHGILVQASIEPDTEMKVKFEGQEYSKWSSSVPYSHEVTFGRAWLITPLGLFLDETGQLRTGWVTSALWIGVYGHYVSEEGTRLHDALPKLGINDAYPKVSWDGTTPFVPLSFGGRWRIAGSHGDPAFRTHPDWWPYEPRSDIHHCQECAPGAPLVPREWENAISRYSRNNYQYDHHDRLLARHLLEFLVRHNAL